MTNYEILLEEAENAGVTVDETSHFCGTRIKGLYFDNHIDINKDIPTDTEKACILAEELGHYQTATSNIIDQSTVQNRKQEMCGRIWAYNKQVGLTGLIKAYKNRCENSHEVAEYLGVTDSFLNDAITYYKNKYGCYTQVDNYIIIFEPTIAVMELI